MYCLSQQALKLYVFQAFFNIEIAVFFFCRPEKGKHICVRNFSLAPLISSVPTFDIRIYMQGTKVVKDAYPVQKDECLRDKEFKMCDYATLKAGAPFS